MNSLTASHPTSSTFEPWQSVLWWFNYFTTAVVTHAAVNNFPSDAEQVRATARVAAALTGAFITHGFYRRHDAMMNDVLNDVLTYCSAPIDVLGDCSSETLAPVPASASRCHTQQSPSSRYEQICEIMGARAAANGIALHENQQRGTAQVMSVLCSSLEEALLLDKHQGALLDLLQRLLLYCCAPLDLLDSLL